MNRKKMFSLILTTAITSNLLLSTTTYAETIDSEANYSSGSTVSVSYTPCSNDSNDSNDSNNTNDSNDTNKNNSANKLPQTGVESSLFILGTLSLFIGTLLSLKRKKIQN